MLSQGLELRRIVVFRRGVPKLSLSPRQSLTGNLLAVELVVHCVPVKFCRALNPPTRFAKSLEPCVDLS